MKTQRCCDYCFRYGFETEMIKQIHFGKYKYFCDNTCEKRFKDLEYGTS